MIGFEPGYEARVVADEVRFNIPDYLLQAALDASYAAKDHTHTADQISGLEGALGSYLTKTEAATTYATKQEISGFITATAVAASFAPLSHTHTIAQVTGLQDQLNLKITSNDRAYPRKVGGGVANFNWNGQSGQPAWVWGGNGGDGDAGNYYVWNPANFSVNYANSTWNAERLQGWDIAGIQNDAQSRANDRGYWATRDYLLGELIPVGCFTFARPTGNETIGLGSDRSGVSLYYSNSSATSSGGQINYGTWRSVSAPISQGAAGLFKRIG